MYLLYSLLLVTWGVLLLPVIWYKAWRYQKYLPGLPERLGRLAAGLRADGRPTIWFHACSVGEVLSVQPLAQQLAQRFPEARLVFSTITKTGRAIAEQRFAGYGEANVFYFPFDLAVVCRRVLDWIQPNLLVIIDTEIWPNILQTAHRRGIPVVLANGRISPRSFRLYRWVRSFLCRVFKDYRLFLMQSWADAERIRMLGAPAERVLVSGNLKHDKDLVERAWSEAVARSLDEALGLTTGGGHLIVAGSTHAGEEEVLLATFRNIRRTPGLEATRLLLVPRHPERFDAVSELAVGAGFRVKRRSDARRPNGPGAEVMLLDSIGELATAYRFATVAFVGGTLIPHGGQSIMEPALYAKPVVVGPSMENFAHIIEDFRSRGGIRQIQATDADKNAQVDELTKVMIELLEHEQERVAMGRAASAVLEASKGATRFTVDRIAGLFEEVNPDATTGILAR